MVVDPGKSVSKEDFSLVDEVVAGPSGVDKNSKNTARKHKGRRGSENSDESMNAEEDFTIDINESEDDNDITGTITYNAATDELSVGDFIEVSFETNKTEKYFIGLVRQVENEIKVTFLRPNRKKIVSFTLSLKIHAL